MKLIGAGGLLKAIRNVNAEASIGFRETLAERGKKISCGRGCAFCCYQKIVCSVIDALPLFLFLQASGAWTPEFQARLAEADREMTAHTHTDWLRLRKPCAFLAEESFGHGLCTVHPVRPIACVGTFSDREPSLCADPDTSTKLLIVQHDAITEYLMRIGAQTLEALELRRVFVYTLPGATLIAAAMIEQRPLPDIHKVEITDETAPGATEDLFDQVAIP